jgi:transposase
MPKRYELSNEQWRRIEDLLAGKNGDRGRTAADNRLFVNAVLWVLRSGARWSDLPERYWEMEERPQALHMLGEKGRLGADFQQSHRRSRQSVSHARHHLGSRPSASRHRKRGGHDQALGGPVGVSARARHSPAASIQAPKWPRLHQRSGAFFLPDQHFCTLWNNPLREGLFLKRCCRGSASLQSTPMSREV